MLLAKIVAVSDAVSSTRSRSEKIELLADTLRLLDPNEAPIAVSYLSGKPTQRKLGAGYATIHGVAAAAATEPTLEIVEVDRVLEEMSSVAGPGAKSRKEALLAELLGRATEVEQSFLRGLMLRNLRQGALEGVMADAVAVALDVPPQR
ncbi:MAG TPA: ATP-dependent DNA ligase, partial [Acidimicrobiia bacterium]|nr:ATP-dependent DNA ligase [Acidimicrobiia bacterium]